jgi:ABC-type multidrug transport system ATPase subunit
MNWKLSGAGKSTFLQAIANRYANGVIVDGRVLVNGQTMTKKMADISGFVYQDDVFIPSLTPKEHLTLMVITGFPYVW